MKKTDEELFKELPAPPEGAAFSLKSVRSVPTGPKGDPHYYVIGPQHINLNEGMYLDIAAVEKKGAKCCHKYCNAPHAAHTTEPVAFIEVEQNNDLNTVVGLHYYLMSIKTKAEELGIAGFAFPKKGQ